MLFDIEDEANDFYHDCELALAKAATINSGLLNKEPSIIEFILNNHDSDPNQPCELIRSKQTP